MTKQPTPETDAVAYRLMTEAINHNKSREAIVFEFEGFARRLEREREEARELLRILAGLVAYGLGQSGEEWSLEAMRQATTAIQNAKALEGAK